MEPNKTDRPNVPVPAPMIMAGFLLIGYLINIRRLGLLGSRHGIVAMVFRAIYSQTHHDHAA